MVSASRTRWTAPFAESAAVHGYQVVLVHSSDRGGPAGGLQALFPALAKGRLHYPAVQVRAVVRAGDAARLIAEQAKDAALVVVGSRGHGGLAGMLLGSVSRAVVEQCECSVVVIVVCPAAGWRTGALRGMGGPPASTLRH